LSEERIAFVFLPEISSGIVLGVGNAPSHIEVLDSEALEELWRTSGAAEYGFSLIEFEKILLTIGIARNYGLPPDRLASGSQRTAFFGALMISDLVLARACAAGNERAWEEFVATYRERLLRAAISITGSTTLGHDLAGALYGELYGVTTREGQRQSPLDSYIGTGSLIGWLRTTLAQRHVDQYRRTHRETALDDYDAPAAAEPQNAPVPLSTLAKAVEDAIAHQLPRERFLLMAYYLDGRTLHQIGELFGVRESTISRWLKRLAAQIRKQILRNLKAAGLSARAAQEALGVDPRELDVNLKKILQTSQPGAFPEKASQ
jgi:RNA polymerase sigma-70 factor (ECF subfamily)